jgi:hypothetical protein
MSGTKKSRSKRDISPTHPDAAAIDIGATMHVAAVRPDRDDNVKFLRSGPDIPADLIAAQERGDVVFICGAGMSLPHGPHNVRDILATHILKQTGSYEQASTPSGICRRTRRHWPQRSSTRFGKRLSHNVMRAARGPHQPPGKRPSILRQTVF